MTSKLSYGTILAMRNGATILASVRLWELNQPMTADDISPELTSTTLENSIAILLKESTRASVGLDWGSFRAHYGPGQLVVRVDVL